ncbi:MAG: alkene reductase [Gammaproteobacteria bacterium]|jgi:N-ethylmaleimide reductase
MNNSTVDLFTPITIGPNTLKNRMVMAPLTRNRAGEGNVPQAMNVEYYRQRASAGLIITEATQISADGVGYPATPGIHSPEQIAGWKNVTGAVHDEGGLIFLQLWYCGRISHPDLLPGHQQPVSASAIRAEGEAVTFEGMKPFVEPRALETDELPGIVDQYRKAAINAKDARFDGVEVHAANGYLLDQFLRDSTNRRGDEYGGSIANRARLLNEVIDAVAELWERSQIGVRISPDNSFNDIHDSDPQALFNHVAEAMSAKQLGYLHVVEGGFRGEHDVDYEQIRQRFNGYYMANLGYDQAKAQAAISNGHADLVSFGTLFLANPDLVARFKANTDLNAPDEATFYGGDEHGYTDYPFMETV